MDQVRFRRRMAVVLGWLLAAAVTTVAVVLAVRSHAELHEAAALDASATALHATLVGAHQRALLLAALAVVGVVLLAGVWHGWARSGARLSAVDDHLQRVHDQQQEFVAVASHELRTPVTVVNGFATTLQGRWEQLSDPERRMVVDRLAGASSRLSGLVEDLMVATLSHRGEVHLAPVEVSASAFVNAALASSRLARTPVQVDVPHDLRVRVDATHGPRMLTNLLDNADRYGLPPHRVTVRGVGDLVEIRVHDEGEGIPGELVPQLFAPFQRASSNRDEHGGIGLGLHIVASLAERSGGWVAHEPGPTGTTFVLALPRVEVAVRPQPLARGA